MIDHIVKPDLVAPGNRIESLLSVGSTIQGELPQNVVNPAEYRDLTGTPAYIARCGTQHGNCGRGGSAALLLQQDPTLTPDAVKARLMKTGNKTFPTQSVIVDPLLTCRLPSITTYSQLARDL